ncbi:prevent-host-death family protein [Aphanothece sacrum FPU1]|uniref:Prevent-host-death family protein n=2 Tax=Aphanothece sacrum TaxID=1122 RepID=A0A401IBG4_APHSA|nr:prevent-host-death family protein [Aphanothece sacrum FPU1]GBF84876.1 prevent-host-death family protein [Aphanothece sacrum FPU3]
MIWRIAQAKQRFSEMIKAATKEPQLIYNREQLVVAVIEAEMFQEFLAWRDRKEKASLADAFRELHQLMAEENYILEIPSRQDRPHHFVDVLNDLSV